MPTGVRSKSHASGTEFAGKRALFGWVMFDWASQPFYTLVVTFLFAPYFVNGFMADPVLGASLWGYATGLAELIAALRARYEVTMEDPNVLTKPWTLRSSLMLREGTRLQEYVCAENNLDLDRYEQLLRNGVEFTRD